MKCEENAQTFNIYLTNPGYTPRWIHSLKANSLEEALEAAAKKYPDIKKDRLQALVDDDL